MVNMDKQTEGVRNLLGDPKKAILKISVPMMLAMMVQSAYNIVDGIWVAGLGADSLAAVGLFFPFFFIVMGLGAGIGIGGSSAISRRIGARDKISADNTANHTIIIGVLISLMISLSLIPFLNGLFTSLSGGANVARLATEYGTVMLGGTFILMFFNMASAILRGEGDTKRAMYAIILGAVMNACLDPFLIYTLDLGVAGAAWSTVISMATTSLIFVYWLFIKKDTYVDIDLKRFSPNRKIIKEIFSVGIPASLAQLSMSITMIAINIIVVHVDGSDGIAVFTSGWRIVMVGIVPIMGIATGVTAVTGAAYGAGNKYKLKTSYFYSVKIGIIIELAVALTIVIFAPQIAYIFTYSPDATRIYDDLVIFLRIMSVITFTVPLGMLTSAMFQGVGKGVRSLLVTILRTLVLTVPSAYIFGVSLDMGLNGVWLGFIFGNTIAVTIAFIWGRITVETVLD